jgi:hypothetical protein
MVRVRAPACWSSATRRLKGSHQETGRGWSRTFSRRALLASHRDSIRPPRLPSHRRVLSLSAPLPCQRRSYGASGVNFHGGESGMDGNKAFYYSPIEENDGVVTNVNPLFYGMLLFSLAGSGKSLATTAVASDVPFTAYTIALADGSTRKDWHCASRSGDFGCRYLDAKSAIRTVELRQYPHRTHPAGERRARSRAVGSMCASGVARTRCARQ